MDYNIDQFLKQLGIAEINPGVCTGTEWPESGGEVLVSESVRRQLDTAFTFSAAREVSVKGKELPLQVFPLA